MKRTKKIILAAFLAIFALGSMTSCNKDVEPIEFTPQSLLAINISDLMRNGLFEIFAYEEGISTKIAKGEELPLTVKVITNDLGDTTGWKSGFNVDETYFRDSITVTFAGGSPLADNSVKTIDCSKLTIPGVNNKLKFFGTIEVINLSTSSTETSREVNTNQFGWGETNNDVYLNASYTFNNTYLNGTMNSCKISGNAMGNHVTYGTFSQEIVTELNAGANIYFTSGVMTFIATYFGGLAYPINVSFTPSSMTVTYKGEINTY
jgi:hypothetical protein